jgi:N-acetyl-anhydromuramyl-L-alanine amidase AmpD
MEPFTVLNNVFKHFERAEPITNIVIHETGGSTASGAVATMRRRGLGCHYLIEFTGEILQCVDPLFWTCHAKGLNKRSIGVEIVNPYAPKNIVADIGYTFCSAKWWTWCPDKNDRRYVLPFKAQLRSLALLIDHLCTMHGVPFLFPTIGIRKKVPAAHIAPGIVAHRDFGKHSDGRYPLEFVATNAKLREIGVKDTI